MESSIQDHVFPPVVKSNTRTLLLMKEKDCKGSVRYKCLDEASPIDTIYLKRDFANPMPSSIHVVVSVVVKSV